MSDLPDLSLAAGLLVVYAAALCVLWPRIQRRHRELKRVVRPYLGEVIPSRPPPRASIEE